MFYQDLLLLINSDKHVLVDFIHIDSTCTSTSVIVEFSFIQHPSNIIFLNRVVGMLNAAGFINVGLIFDICKGNNYQNISLSIDDEVLIIAFGVPIQLSGNVINAINIDKLGNIVKYKSYIITDINEGSGLSIKYDNLTQVSSNDFFKLIKSGNGCDMYASKTALYLICKYSTDEDFERKLNISRYLFNRLFLRQ